MTLQTAIQERVVGLCRERKIPLNVLSARSGISMSGLDALLRNRDRNIRMDTIEKICEGFDISIADFFCCDMFRDLEPDSK